MSLLEKLPPLVSALAFGYGVGMAAPDSSLQGVRSPFVWDGQTASAKVASPHRPAAVALNASLEKKLPGGESEMLRELRAARAPSRFAELPTGMGYPQEARPARLYDEDLADEADEFEATSAAVSRLQLPDLGLGVSRQTLKYVRFFTKTDRGRSMFETWLKRSGRYQEMIQEELRARALPEDLIWVAMIESGFDATARSPVGAVGLWQFMPATGAVYGLRQNKFIDQRKNPRLATQAAAHHLRDLYMRFGQWDLALAAYNMGYEQLLDRMDRVGTTDFNELVRAGVMPSETSKYVPKILAAALVANNLERFDFDDVAVSKSVDTAEIAVPPRTPLDVVAKAAGVPASTIRKLNPDVLAKELPPGKGDFLINVPPESVARATAALPTMLDLHRGRIDDGDFLDPVDLMSPEGYRATKGEDDDSLLSLLPKPKKKRRALRDPLLDDGLDSDLAQLREAERLRDELDGDRDKKRDRDVVLYRVGANDTLRSIAKQFSASADDVARDNGMQVDEKLKEGALIRLKVHSDLLDAPSKKTGRSDGDRPKAKRPDKG